MSHGVNALRYMERPCRYHAAKISVFSEHICNGNASIAGTDINFLTNMQKGENLSNRFPSISSTQFSIMNASCLDFH